MHRAQSGFTLADYEHVVKELQEHKAQAQNLSKLLLKKQGAVLELQAERSALKSRLIDMQARYISWRVISSVPFSSLRVGDRSGVTC
jgi:hypothetical protein